ncbi:E3 ubiquitin-protein ligase RNF180-like [Arctopsyche grandis]|uniref:E3 ubiquitin-protein ligase RNF180-like n=1 Tax=Arctopsyche grandis TaxID=121162 RepID=UPI00406D6781
MDEVRCRGCAREIWRRSESPLVNAHGRPLEEVSDAPVGASPCEDWRHGQVFAEGEILPTWVETAVSESGWCVGKLMCECGAPLGSFDFVSGRRCIVMIIIIDQLKCTGSVWYVMMIVYISACGNFEARAEADSGQAVRSKQT